MLVIAWPACVRRPQAPIELCASSLNWSGTLRMPIEPSAWQDWQDCFIVSTQASCVLIFEEMPLPLSPVPGNWSFPGTLIIEYQYMPGYFSASSFALAALALKSTVLPSDAFTFSVSAMP